MHLGYKIRYCFKIRINAGYLKMYVVTSTFNYLDTFVLYVERIAHIKAYNTHITQHFQFFYFIIIIPVFYRNRDSQFNLQHRSWNTVISLSPTEPYYHISMWIISLPTPAVSPLQNVYPVLAHESTSTLSHVWCSHSYSLPINLLLPLRDSPSLGSGLLSID